MVNGLDSKVQTGERIKVDGRVKFQASVLESWSYEYDSKAKGT